MHTSDKISGFTSQMESICFKMFSNEELFLNLLHYFYYHIDEKWYNIISIFSNISDAIEVHTLEDWATILKVNNVYPIKNQCGVPYVTTYQDINLDFTDYIDKKQIVKVFDYSQLNFEYEQFEYLKNKKYDLINPLQDKIDKDLLSKAISNFPEKLDVLINKCLIEEKYNLKFSKPFYDFIICSVKEIYYLNIKNKIENFNHFGDDFKNEDYFHMLIAILSIGKKVFYLILEECKAYEIKKEQNEYLEKLKKRRKRKLKNRIHDAKSKVQKLKENV